MLLLRLWILLASYRIDFDSGWQPVVRALAGVCMAFAALFSHEHKKWEADELGIELATMAC